MWLLYIYRGTKPKKKEKKKTVRDLIRYKGVTKALVVSELIAIFHAKHRKS